MTHEQILTKAIETAIEGGLTGYWADRYHKCKELDEMEFLIAGDIYEEGHSPEEIIFNHDFAKALWGDEIEYGDNTPYDEYPMPAWQMHLQQMVIADDPIQYLGEHL